MELVRESGLREIVLQDGQPRGVRRAATRPTCRDAERRARDDTGSCAMCRPCCSRSGAWRARRSRRCFTRARHRDRAGAAGGASRCWSSSLRSATGDLAQRRRLHRLFQARTWPSSACGSSPTSVAASAGVGVGHRDHRGRRRSRSSARTAASATRSTRSTDNPLPHALDRAARPNGATARRDSNRCSGISRPGPKSTSCSSTASGCSGCDAILDLLRAAACSARRRCSGSAWSPSSATPSGSRSRTAAPEIEITKLVGGTNAFVRRPFLYTGLFYGGSGRAAGRADRGRRRWRCSSSPVRRLAAQLRQRISRWLACRCRSAACCSAPGPCSAGWARWISAARHLRRRSNPAPEHAAFSSITYNSGPSEWELQAVLSTLMTRVLTSSAIRDARSPRRLAR